MVRNHIADTLELAREHLHTQKIQNKKYYDEKINEIELNIDDLVLVKNQNKNHKFDDVYEGPFRVIDVRDSYAEILKGNKKVKLHKNLIKKVKSNDVIA